MWQAIGLMLAFFVMSMALALWVFPQWRLACWRWLAPVTWRWRHWAAKRALWVGGGGLVLLAPALLVWFWQMGQSRVLEGFDDTVSPTNWHVAWLLQGEQLTPPPPLPPEVFETAEVVLERPMLATADRRWAQLEPDFVQRLLRVYKVMKDEHGYDMVLLEGWRSPERQAMLARQGAHVTQVGAGRSYHQYGLAADSAFFRDGKLVISERDPWAMRGYELYGLVAEQHGLTWGGRWRMMDFGHVELRKPEIRQRINGASPP